MITYVIGAAVCLLLGWYGNEVYRRYKDYEKRRDRKGYDRHKQRTGDG